MDVATLTRVQASVERKVCSNHEQKMAFLGLPLASLVFALCLPVFRPTWRLYDRRPDDATLSCYQHWNGSWSCTPDSTLDVDPDDSY